MTDAQTQALEGSLVQLPAKGSSFPVRPILLAPWRGIFAPRAAAAAFAKAPPVEIMLSILLAGTVLACSSALFVISNMTYEIRDHIVKGSNPTRIEYTWHQRTTGEVWSQVKDNGPLFLATSGAAAGFWMLLAVLAAAAIHWHRVHERGSLRQSFTLSLRGAAAGAGVIAFLSLVGVGSESLTSRLAWSDTVARGLMTWQPTWYTTLLSHASSILYPVGMFWTGWFVRGIRPVIPSDDLPPRCEGCGYDLRHRPSGGRCAECGLEVDHSLAPQVARRGCAWENRPSPQNWLKTSAAALFTPRRFHRQLRMRTSDNASAVFAALHYACLAIAAAVIINTAAQADYYRPYSYTGGYYVGGYSPFDSALYGAFDLLVVCWIAHRGVGLLATAFGRARGLIPNLRWAAKVQDYEVVVLRAFALTTLVATVLLNWRLPRILPYMAPMVFAGAWSGAFVIPRAILVAGVLVVPMWLLRYRRAFRAIRWSNF